MSRDVRCRDLAGAHFRPPKFKSFLPQAHLGLASRSGPSGSAKPRYHEPRFAADDPAHRRIVAQAFGIVHIIVTGEAAEHRLTQQTDQRMATVLARARISEGLA